MSTRSFNVRRAGGPGLTAAVAGALLLAMMLASAPAQAQSPLTGLTVIGVDANGGETPVDAYRWLIEEDKTYHVQTDASGAALPTVFDPNWEQYADGVPGGETLSVSFHRSYMPVVGKGCAGYNDYLGTDYECKALAPVLKPNTYYFVSVLPRAGASIGGAGFKTGGDGAMPPTTVYVNRYPIPTAQITVLIFHDNNSINNAPDLPAEDPLTDGDGDGEPDNPMAGFQILVEDAGGRYGASAGMQSQDAFGNPLGTEYDAAGNVIGWHPLITGPDGRLTIKNLAPGKYGVQAVPPAGSGYQQTATIEGTKVIDAWVKANEPAFFAELGPPGFHVFIGFVKKFNSIPAGGGTTITGQIVNNHMSRPPMYAFNEGTCFGHTTPWVGLNEMVAGLPGPGLYAAPTGDFNGDGDGCEFEIPNVPPGDYQLVVWDSALDLIFAFHGVTIGSGTGTTCDPGSAGVCNLGPIPVFQWFHRSEHRVFDDINANGVWDTSEGPAAAEQAFNLRWRDGTIYQTNVSDGVGAFTFDQVFPFFNWLVAEVDFLRFQATGLTVVVDDGGAISAVSGPAPYDDNDITFGGAITPQDQTNPVDPFCLANPTVCEENAAYRVERGPVLLQGFQGFLGQTNAFLWGKRHYPDGQNGGISGIVFYSVTRAENNPQYGAAEVWEPGIPGVTVNLRDSNGRLLDTTVTDSWDESLPTGCKWGNGATGPFAFDPDGTGIGIGPFPQDCYDGLRNFNQARPAVFDGGYAFGPEFDCAGGCPSWLEPSLDNPDIGYLKPGDYIVEVIPPPGYEIVKPEDKNVDFGDAYEPAPELLPPPCVGPMTPVPAYLSLFADEQIPAPFAGTSRPLCNRKLVTVSAGANAAADFFLFTEVPIAAHATGFILDDTASEFDPNSPQFGEKFAPPFVPITVRDWTGRIINKTYSDQYGVYNFVAPSTSTANLPQPSGMSANMLTTCMNDPGDDLANPDPNFNPQYSTFCYNFQYMPGVTTYLDTPVLPSAAFTGPEQFPLDCEYPDGTPRIYSVDVATNGVGGGPYIPTAGNVNNRGVNGDQTITINSLGTWSVQNPDYCNPAAGMCPAGADTVNRFIFRDFGFGDVPGVLTLGDMGVFTMTDDGDPATATCADGGSWTNDVITCTIADDTTVPNDTAANTGGGRQLTVTRGDNGRSTVAGVTVQVGLRAQSEVIVVTPSADPMATPITDAILANSTNANALILVQPGAYNEMVIMTKPVQLQGWGEGSTIINALKAPTEKLQAWRDRVDGLVSSGTVDLLPGQEVGLGLPEPTTLQTEEGAGVLVLARSGGNNRFDFGRNRGARIDGLTIKGADTGGGVIANGYTDYLRISNNRIANNSGFFSGGIRVGHPILVNPATLGYTDGDNDRVAIHHNQVVFNGGLGGTGGGISMCTGSDSYRITENWVCGNFTGGEGAGIGHTGLSQAASGTDYPLIADNTVIFNESFYQAQTVSGGGIFVGGAAPLGVGERSPGAGNVQIIGNLIHGNSAGAGDGGGIRLAAVNGEDVADNPGNPAQWYAVDVYNNMIVNNVAALAGGGISLQDAVEVRILNNTIANNDSLAVAGEAFAPGSPNLSNAQPGAGVVSRAHSALLASASGGVGTFSEPSAFADNIVWQNRSFYFYVDSAGCTPGTPGCLSTYGLCPDVTGGLTCPGGNDIVFDDLGVIGTAGTLSGTDNLVTPGGWVAPGPTDPSTLFVNEYFNGARSSILQPEITTAIQTPAAFDEGGNYIKPAFGPLSLWDDAASNDGDPGVLYGDYHILSGSAAHDAAAGGLGDDFDGDARPQGAGFDIGADEQAPLGLKALPGGAGQDAIDNELNTE
ncbi:MAG TPA: hypothetical protein PKJ99_04180 [Thermoanaerobaculales bacterium]|nr:hypothetical protein [Thermoanaerobaculales bacterium]